MPRAFISSGVSVLAAPLGAGWPPGAPENSLTPTNTSSSAIGISSHLSSGLLFIARSSGRAGRGGRRQVRGGIDRAQRRQQRLGQAVAARDQVERSDARRVGQERVSTSRSGVSQLHKKEKTRPQKRKE